MSKESAVCHKAGPAKKAHPTWVGSYHEPSGRSPYLLYTANAFEKAIYEVHPDVLRSLAREPFEAYIAMADGEPANGHDLTLVNIWFGEYEDCWNPDNPQPCPAPPEGWVSPLRAWSKRWNLYDLWGCVGVGALASWYLHLSSYDPRSDPHPKETCPYLRMNRICVEGVETAQTLAVPIDWDPFAERWEDVARATRIACETELAAYKARVERDLAAHGYVHVPPLRKPEHYRWLAEAIVLELSADEIAENHSVCAGAAGIVDANTVRMANKRTAELLSFSCPKRRAGRPREVKNRKNRVR